MDDTLQRMVQRVLDERYGFVERGLRQHLGEIEELAKSEWPVKTGESRDGFYTGIRVERNAVVGFLANRSPHVFYVKGRRHGGGRSWTAVLRIERKTRTRLVELLGRELLEAHGGP